MRHLTAKQLSILDEELHTQFGVRLADLITNTSRHTKVVRARWALWYILQRKFGWSYNGIAKYTKRDHTSIAHGIIRAEEIMENTIEEANLLYKKKILLIMHKLSDPKVDVQMHKIIRFMRTRGISVPEIYADNVSTILHELDRKLATVDARMGVVAKENEDKLDV